MGDYYTALSSGECVEDAPSVGLPCVVRFKADDRFYRSQILSIHGQFAQVLFVDYGNEQETPLKELKRIHPRFIQCPQMVCLVSYLIKFAIVLLFICILFYTDLAVQVK